MTKLQRKLFKTQAFPCNRFGTLTSRKQPYHGYTAKDARIKPRHWKKAHKIVEQELSRAKANIHVRVLAFIELDNRYC